MNSVVPTWRPAKRRTTWPRQVLQPELNQFISVHTLITWFSYNCFSIVNLTGTVLQEVSTLTSELCIIHFPLYCFLFLFSSSFIFLRANDGNLNANYRRSKHWNTICSYCAFISTSHSHSAYSFAPKPQVFPLSLILHHIFHLHRLLPFLLRLTCRPISIFPSISWNFKVNYNVHKNMPLLCILCRMNCIHILVPNLFEINFSIIYPFMYGYTYVCVCVYICRSPKVLWQFYVHVSSVPCFQRASCILFISVLWNDWSYQ
jgi:hypothetical protein